MNGINQRLINSDQINQLMFIHNHGGYHKIFNNNNKKILNHLKVDDNHSITFNNYRLNWLNWHALSGSDIQWFLISATDGAQ